MVSRYPGQALVLEGSAKATPPRNESSGWQSDKWGFMQCSCNLMWWQPDCGSNPVWSA